MTRIVTGIGLLIAPAVLAGQLEATRGLLGQDSTSIRNFQAREISSAQLEVSVDYSYAGDSGRTDVTIHATPEAGGAFDPRVVEFDALPVLPGEGTAILTITKREGARDFTSVSIRVCISTETDAILCRDFPYEKAWTGGPPPAAAPPPPPPAPETCSISGRVAGKLRWPVSTNPRDHRTVTLREIQLEQPGGATPTPAPIADGRYTFADLEAGVTYRLYPSGFRSDPTRQNVRCRANTRHRIRDFRIVGPPPRQG